MLSSVVLQASNADKFVAFLSYLLLGVIRQEPQVSSIPSDLVIQFQGQMPVDHPEATLGL